MKLKQWFDIPNPDGTKRRRNAFAARLGVTPSMVTCYCEETSWPGREIMAAIWRETGGEVTPNDFLSIVPGEGSPQETIAEAAQ